MLGFASEYEAERFRVRMHQFKKLQDRALDTVGVQELKDAPAFSFLFNKATKVATISFVKKKSGGKEFPVFKILDSEESEVEKEDETVSAHLGSHKEKG